MMFDGVTYWLFFFTVAALVVYTRPQIGRFILVAASFIFYGAWDVRFVALLAASTFLNYGIGLKIRDQRDVPQKSWLIVGITTNLAALGFFKYYNFFAGSLAAVLGLPTDAWALNILLPVGISFFTFEGIAYLSDIYKNEIKAQRNVVNFALFLSFFPHLISGPIIRPHHFFPQVYKGWNLTQSDVRWSYIQIVKGLFKKIVLADAMAVIADTYFDGGQGVSALLGTLAFTLQIYFDFSGYTDIARGCALLLGFRFPSNFERPYFSPNISDFWRRWHISLSTWLRDYLYIPLGGNRLSRAGRYRNYLVVMGLGGLWHGASWNFLIWGLYHGFLLLGHRVYLEYAPNKMLALFKSRIGYMVSVAFTFILVTLGWIPFRAHSFNSAWDTFSQILNTTSYPLANIPLTFIIALVGVLLFCLLDQGRRIQNYLSECAPMPLFVLSFGIMSWLTIVFAHRGTSIPFIYFKF